jgi:hypothetical protein
MIGVAMGFGCLLCPAQNAPGPIRQMNQQARLSALAPAPSNEVAFSRTFEMPAASSSSAGFVLTPPKNRFPRTASTGFFLLNGLHLGMAIFDVEMTQHCLADHHCVEGNPLMPSSACGQLGVAFATVGFGTLASYRLKKNDSKLWILSPTVGIAAHTLGVATGFAHR